MDREEMSVKWQSRQRLPGGEVFDVFDGGFERALRRELSVAADVEPAEGWDLVHGHRESRDDPASVVLFGQVDHNVDQVALVRRVCRGERGDSVVVDRERAASAAELR